jgi:CubicO group peptidase (beta-lactamase class C family)
MHRVSLVAAFVFAGFCLSMFLHAQANRSADLTNTQASTAHMHRVETEFPPVDLGHNQPPLLTDLQQLMRMYKIPALSVAIIDNFKIDWAKGYGVTEAGGAKPVTTATLFQAASISKPVTSAAALYVVERDRLSLDEDVNRRLVSWKVPKSEFTINEKVTLRRLLNHTSGANIEGGFNGYDINDPLPTIKQTLNGDKPANHEPIVVDFVPGSKWRYSGGGYAIVQELLIDTAGTPVRCYFFSRWPGEQMWRFGNIRPESEQVCCCSILRRKHAPSSRTRFAR